MIPQLLTAGASILGNIAGRGQSQSTSQRENMTETISRGSTPVDSFLNSIIAQYDPESAEDVVATSVGQAEEQTGAMVDRVFRGYEQEVLPEIFNASRGSGVYGSSGAQELADRGYAEATGQAAELTLAQANTLSQQRLGQQQQMEQFITQLFGVDLEQTGETTTRGIATSTGSGTSPVDTSGISSSLIQSMTAQDQQDSVDGLTESVDALRGGTN